MIDKERAFSRLKQLGFVRIGGSEEELKSVSLLSQELEVAQIHYELESCEVRAYDIPQLELKVLEPYDVLEIWLSGSTPNAGIKTECLYVEEATPLQLREAKGKIVLINGRLNAKRYEQFVKAEVAGIISFGGSAIDDSNLRVLNW